MIYLDNAATTSPKPRNVYRTLQNALSEYGANPGRSSYPYAAKTSEAVYNSRQICADFFGASTENTVFTLNCTQAINYAVKGMSSKGAHFVISDMEHNAVLRPVHAACENNGGSYTLFEAVEDIQTTVKNAERAIRPETRAMIVCAASNVFGLRNPIKELAEVCGRHGICFVVDAAQGAGVLPISLSDGINIICAAGHKGLYGPMGTGLLITDGKFPLKTIIEGGTGSMSENVAQPDFLPDRFESGTINTPGVIALGAGVEYVRRVTPARILSHELTLCEQFCEGARRIRGVILYNDITPQNSRLYAPVVSFNLKGLSSTEATGLLGERGFCMRGGLHCAPLAHKKYGTLDTGTVRFSPSAFTTPREVGMLIQTLKQLAL